MILFKAPNYKGVSEKPLSPPDTWVGHYNANNIPDISPVKKLMLMGNEYKPHPICNCKDCR